MNLASFVPGLSQAQWIATGVAALALVGGSVYATHHWDSAAYNALVAKQAKAQVAAVTQAAAAQKKLDAAGTKASTTDAVAQQQIVTRTVTLTKEVPVYVTRAQDQAADAPGARPGCVSYGVVRVLDAAVLGVSPSSLALPAGKSDDDCSPVDPSALAAGVAGNYGVAQQNAQQLNDLIDTVKDQATIIVATPHQ